MRKWLVSDERGTLVLCAVLGLCDAPRRRVQVHYELGERQLHGRRDAEGWSMAWCTCVGGVRVDLPAPQQASSEASFKQQRCAAGQQHATSKGSISVAGSFHHRGRHATVPLRPRELLSSV
jgi:hypothetical protein